MKVRRSNPPPRLDSGTLAVVRPEVRGILESAPSFRKLADPEKRDLAQSMVKVAAYMANPDGLAARELSGPGILATSPNRRPAVARARAQADDARDAAVANKGFAGEDFKAGAVKQGVQQFGELVRKVDFPAFVSGLIQNVFQAIVDASIKQMRAYGELLANVAKTVDQFMQDNITANNARDWLLQKYPGKLDLDTSAMSGGFAEGDTPPPAPRLVAVGDDSAAVSRQISQDLQLAQPINDISDENDEARLVLAARMQIARSRQQLLSSMVILGINRIVVTDGLIHAKVVFDMRASDVAARRSRASLYDSDTASASFESSISAGGWLSPVDASMKNSASTSHVATVESSVDESSESKAEVKAKLTGEVRVNFKSDYFPMEKLASPQMIAAISGNAKPIESGTYAPPKDAATAPAKG